MKFLMAVVATVSVVVILGWGILLAASGNPWLLIVGSLAYLAAFVKLGCLPTQSH